MKKKLKSLSLLGVITLLSLGSSSVYAESVTEATYEKAIDPSGIVIFAEAKYPGPGTYYEPYQTTREKSTDFSMEVSNTGGGTTSVTRTVSIRKFANVTIGGETELKIMAQKVKASLDVNAGVDSTKSVSITWSIPAKSVYTIKAGSVVVKTSGYIERANSSGVVVSSTYNSGNWTTSEFSDSIFVRKL
ncbi:MULTISPECIES: hypothetical protein [Paenibacillus]|uniref:Uncharacterized protein n=1 Tax=Paenibacillus peoriae TaxID=59893 RepID=A0ABU1Q9C5_9BACL|nr:MULTISPECIES: hypothetical protein [Paenibacillus]MDR6776236.1 hypothetical protein [Paenibacillus peoriae]OMF72112.1 hypothetical protein BK145_26195 [Paenibacillus peoriae]QYK68236.1 hypothetical protein KAI36_03387 [Paenibacillus sp. S02]